MQLTVINNITPEFLNDWRRLFRGAPGTFFDNPDWLLSRVTERDKLYILAVMNSSQLIGLLPLRLEHRSWLGKRFWALTHLANEFSDYKGMLIAASSDIVKVRRLFAKELASFKSWDLLELRDLNSTNDSLNYLSFRLASQRQLLSAQNVGEVIVKTDVESMAFPKKAARELRKASNELSSKGHLEVRHSTCISESAVRQLLQLRSEIYRVNNDILTDTSINEVVQQLLAPELKGSVLYSEILLDGRQISQHIGFISSGEFYYYLPIFDREYSSYSPGKLLLGELRNYCVEQKISTFNFLRGGEQYKWNWANEVSFNYELFVVSKTSSLRLKLLCFAHKIKGALRFFH